MCSLRFENIFLSNEGVRFASISKKTLLSKLSFAFVSLALPLLVTFNGYTGPTLDIPLFKYVSMFETYRLSIYSLNRFTNVNLLLVVGNGDNEEDWMSSSLLGRASYYSQLHLQRSAEATR
jgi:hypothetical protein